MIIFRGPSNVSWGLLGSLWGPPERFFQASGGFGGHLFANRGFLQRPGLDLEWFGGHLGIWGGLLGRPGALLGFLDALFGESGGDLGGLLGGLGRQEDRRGEYPKIIRT